MTPEALCALALAAHDDLDARPVLADAVEQSGWWDDRLDQWMERAPAGAPVWGGAYRANAIAAVLLFGDWPEEWPLAAECSFAETDDELRSRLLGYWSPWASGGVTVDDIMSATSAQLDEFARDVYAMPRR